MASRCRRCCCTAWVFTPTPTAKKSFQVLQAAIDLALDLGMNRRDFAVENGEGCPILEESWRRTFLGAVRRRRHVRCRDAADVVSVARHPERCAFAVRGERVHVRGKASNFLLPKENKKLTNDSSQPQRIPPSEKPWKISTTPSSRTKSSSRRTRIASSPSATWASPCRSRIRTVRTRTAIDFADASIVNWSLHLPATKRDPVDKDGRLDEMLFQAHMVNRG